MPTSHTRNRARRRALAVGLLAAGGALAGCNDFIGAPSAAANPNNPTAATNNQLLVGVEVNQTALLTGDIARTIGLWMQQFSGTQGQYISYAAYDVAEDFTESAWGTVYQGGGLQDLRVIQTRADAAGDSVTAGIARVMEGLIIGTAADLWGDVPYSAALTVGEPATFDEQAAVYAAVQQVLDRGIAQLESGAGNGPGASDLWYGGDPELWIEAANTIKARFYLHTAERQGTAADGTPAFDPAAYQAALTAAQEGISAPANNLVSYQSTSPQEQNLWYQFTVIARNGYLFPSDYFVNLLKSRNDPRLTRYFEPGGGATEIFGSPTTNGAASTTARLNSATVGAPDYQQPIVTYAENQLIIAEAQFRLGNAGAALTALNNARAAQNLPAVATLPTGADGLTAIMTEKYISLFENPEIWNDYRRTCVPALQPIAAAGAGVRIPSRFLYPLNERTTNPNVPDVADQPVRNDNDPNPCAVGGTQTSD